MSAEENKAAAMRFTEVVINQGHGERAQEFLAPDFVDHQQPPGFPAGMEGVKQFITQFRAAFPDLHYHVEDTVAEGDMVVQRVTGHGTMKGEFQGMPATGKHAMWQEIHMSRFKNGKVVEHWAVVDQLGMLQQLGHAPMPGA